MPRENSLSEKPKYFLQITGGRAYFSAKGIEIIRRATNLNFSVSNKYSNISNFLEQFKTTWISDIVQISMQCIICYLMDFFMRDDHFLLIFVCFFGNPVWFLGSQFPNQGLNLGKPNQGFPLQQKHGVLTTELSGNSLLLGVFSSSCRVYQHEYFAFIVSWNHLEHPLGHCKTRNQSGKYTYVFPKLNL